MSDLPYSIIRVSGPDAFEFLQAQLSADLRQLHKNGGSDSAWCNPKGRVICTMHILMRDDAYTLAVPDEMAEDILKRLTMFRFRSKVEFELQPATAEAIGIDGDYEEWRLENLRAGVPEILAAQSEEFTAHMLNLDLLDWVSVDKGCYPGQEIIARTHFRGATKRRLHRFESAAPVFPGDKVRDGERTVGEVVNAIGNELLAVVPTDKAGVELHVGDIKLEARPIRYLSE